MNIFVIAAQPLGPCWLGKGNKPEVALARHLVQTGLVLSVELLLQTDQPTAVAALAIAATSLDRAGVQRDVGGWWSCTPAHARAALTQALEVANGQASDIDDSGEVMTVLIEKIGAPPSIVAQVCGVHLTSVKRWQRGELRPDWAALAALRRYAEAVGVSLTLDDILGPARRSAEVVDLPARRRRSRNA